MRAEWQLVETETGRTVVENCELADTYWSRLVGWQLRAVPTVGRGLLLVPCASVHTCLLRFALDLVMLDRSGRVLAVRRGIRPWRAVLAPRGTHAVLEMASPGADVAVGQVLRARHSAGAELPKSLRFLA
ncbi:MAG TPA: DUF192 domain-containing protein [Planctomycetaceae bacterium]|jgi:hypothetical protein|nr:DUF192 domain-containing protein [Planctomycetaceae bacterium]